MLSNTHRVYCNILKILLQNIRLIDPCLKEPVAITSGHVATMTMMMRPTLQAGMTSEDHPERLMIALEPEAASIYVRKLRLYQLVPNNPVTQTLPRSNGGSTRANRYSYFAPDSTASGTPLRLKPLECNSSNNMKFVHWPLMSGLLHLVQRLGGAATQRNDTQPTKFNVRNAVQWKNWNRFLIHCVALRICGNRPYSRRVKELYKYFIFVYLRLNVGLRWW